MFPKLLWLLSNFAEVAQDTANNAWKEKKKKNEASKLLCGITINLRLLTVVLALNKTPPNKQVKEANHSMLASSS